jgi:hypothetical protein
MTESGSAVYRVVPKCGCSTIGQILHFSDHGRFYEGDIHDAETGLRKWSQEHSRSAIEAAALSGAVPRFTCVRNPYARILSSFFDKICGIQRNGKRYRGNLVPLLAQTYGIETGSPETGWEFDQISAFRRFLLFARDTIRFRKPMEPDIHWSPMASHLGTFVAGGGRFDHVLRLEAFVPDMRDLLSRIEFRHAADPAAVPRFNESEGHGPKRAYPVEAYFDDLSRHLMLDVYGRDFRLFGYDPDRPESLGPVREIDLETMHEALAE